MGIIDEIKGAISKEGISSRVSEIKEVFTGSGEGTYREVKPKEVKSEPEEVNDTYEDVVSETGSYGKHVEKKIKGGYEGLKKSAYGYAIRSFETEEEKDFRIKEKEQRKIEKATIGMSKQEKAAYEETHLTRKRTKAEEKAKHDVSIGETYDEKRARIKKEQETEREISASYRKARASAAGTASIKDITSKKEAKKKGRQAGSERPQSQQGLYNPMFSRPQYVASTPAEMHNPMFSQQPLPTAPVQQPQPAPQPERRMSRREQHRQQARNEMNVQRNQWMQDQQQQMPSYLVPQTQPMRGYQPPKGRLPEQPRFRNLFEGHKPTNNNGNGSNKQSMPKMVNLFERHDVPTNTKIGGHKPHPLAEFSASSLGIDSIGTSRNGKRKHVKALWE